MGRAKFALPLGAGHTFASRIAATLDAAGVRPLIMVGSLASAADLRVALGAYAHRATVVVNERPEDGQLSSLQAGLATIALHAPAVLVSLVDLPAVDPLTISAIAEAWERTNAPLVRPARLGRHGHPFVVGHAALDALRRAPHTTTIRDVLQPFVAHAIDVVTDDDGAFEDVDTPDDYARLLKRSPV
jgi:CTP:molybdopterin cytidylyltransferase MocA